MFPFLVGGALLAAAAYAIWQLMKLLRQKAQGGGGSGGLVPGDEGDQDSDQDKQPSDGVGGESTVSPEFARARARNELIDRVSRQIQFARGQKISIQRVESLVPADDIEMRPIRDMSEVDKLTTQAHAQPDDLFFGQLAGRQLQVVQHLEDQIVEEPAHNVLIMVIDCSGSMGEYERSEWARQLCERLTERCIHENAEVVLITFNDAVRGIYHAKTDAERRSLLTNMGRCIFHDGGTNINIALLAGMDIVERGSFDEARMLLVTDGTVGIDTQEVQQRLRQLKVNLHTIVIAGDHPQLREVSNRYDVLSY